MSNKRTKTIILIRHAKSEHHIGNNIVFAGSGVDSNIVKEEIIPIKNLAKKIINLGGCDLIIHGSLKRTRQTAEIIADEIKQITGTSIKISQILEIAEVNLGDFTGRNTEWVKEKYPTEYSNFLHGRIENIDFPDGEKYSDVVSRIKILLSKLSELDDKYKRILLVGHAIFNRILLRYLFPDKPKLWIKDYFPHERIDIFNLKQNV